MTSKRAFTLIELLVVISIISILLSIVSASFITSQKRARDARRRQDLAKIQTALEQYYTRNGFYPTTNNISSAFQGSQLPTDPKNNGNYVYNFSQVTSSQYCICAKLEQAGHGNANAPTTPVCNWASQGDYLCIQNQQ